MIMMTQSMERKSKEGEGDHKQEHPSCVRGRFRKSRPGHGSTDMIYFVQHNPKRCALSVTTSVLKSLEVLELFKQPDPRACQRDPCAPPRKHHRGRR